MDRQKERLGIKPLKLNKRLKLVRWVIIIALFANMEAIGFSETPLPRVGTSSIVLDHDLNVGQISYTLSTGPGRVYDIVPPETDGRADVRDLSAWLELVSEGAYDPTLLFDFSLRWQSTLPPSSATAEYRVTFQTLWSPQTHPTDYPSGAHFSGLVGGTHNDSVSFWDVGELATPGIRDMAERGIQGVLAGEVGSAVGAGSAEFVLLGGGIGRVPGSVDLEFVISRDFSLVTLVSMIAPSPDWFVGVAGLDLFQNGDWVEEMTVTLQPYDAGTDSGATYSSPNQISDPKEPIFELLGPPFIHEGEVAPMGQYVFERID